MTNSLVKSCLFIFLIIPTLSMGNDNCVNIPDVGSLCTDSANNNLQSKKTSEERLSIENIKYKRLEVDENSMGGVSIIPKGGMFLSVPENCIEIPLGTEMICAYHKNKETDDIWGTSSFDSFSKTNELPENNFGIPKSNNNIDFTSIYNSSIYKNSPTPNQFLEPNYPTIRFTPSSNFNYLPNINKSDIGKPVHTDGINFYDSYGNTANWDTYGNSYNIGDLECNLSYCN